VFSFPHAFQAAKAPAIRMKSPTPAAGSAKIQTGSVPRSLTQKRAHAPEKLQDVS
jgi:hypothetical protein